MKEAKKLLKKVENILLSKGIAATEEELKALALQWEGIQQLKQHFSEANVADADIALTHDW